jgi:hypothetical protein
MQAANQPCLLLLLLQLLPFFHLDKAQISLCHGNLHLLFQRIYVILLQHY